ncbi:MAG: hypothetical protein A3K22_02305 [Deltaproteobacteria bacterium RBG_16_42_7]|nr:MAG: hypothetical protein A3K22_02305 [Deltaproteobacteria bacterium RBG_16_42_7]
MKEDLIYVSHILTALADIKEFTVGMTKKDFLKSKMAEHAVVRNIEVIGEASKHLSSRFKEKHKDIPWKDMIKMRNKETHFYFGINYEIVWNVVKRDVPALGKKLKAIAEAGKK